MSYITLQQLKNYLGQSNSTILLDSNLNEMILSSNSKINGDLTINVIREPIYYINDIKKNDIDGTNKKFYVRNWFGKYFGDLNDDGSITKDDVIVIQKDSNSVETELTVSSIDAENMGFTLSAAPSSDMELFVTYKYSYFDMSTPDQRIKDLARYLCLMKSYFELEIGLIGTSAKAGNISLSGIDKNTKASKYNNLAKELLNDLKMVSNSKRKAVNIDIAINPRYRREEYLSNPGEIYPYNRLGESE
jgi:hypothetical protein